MAGDLPQISDEMVREFNRAFNESADQYGDDDPNRAARAGLAAALAVSGWTPPMRRCAAFAAPPVINGEVAGDCDPHACTKSADHVGPWHVCRCGVMFTLAAQPDPPS